MSSETRYELAKALSKFAHDGQVDKGGNPYYLHPLAVSEAVVGEDEKITALLHDVVEDTDIAVDTIRDLFGDTIVEAVLSVTRLDGEDYFDFVRRAKRNPIGRVVKLADLNHNLDASRLPEVTEKDAARLEKYRKAVEILSDDD
ncbi:MAG: HD domain-containing protein [Clostridia bacterium]|nr:HD domain-containing protein [Clostridia bacterium]